jgi:uncharacterized 2Fe-2S/4Fe-4S cluster protein (DUF4445 family)
MRYGSSITTGLCWRVCLKKTNLNIVSAHSKLAAPPAHFIALDTPDGETRLPFQAGSTLRDILMSGGFLLHSACGGNGICGQCQVHIANSGSIPFATAERLRLSAAQLGDGVRLACCVIPDQDLRVSIDQSVAQMNWRALREDEYGSSPQPASFDVTERYGVAIDLGTTHIRLTLWDLFARVRIIGLASLNPQASFGADVLTRLMEAARSPEAALEIGRLVLRAIAQALAEISVLAAIRPDEVGRVLIVGNTAMLSLLSGRNYTQLLQPENWTRRIDCQPLDSNFLREAWGLAAPAEIRFVTPVGGFIGSDLLSGVIASRLIGLPAGALLIDFGTNSEMALWDGHTLHVTSAAGGPAFEGSGIGCGMPGEAGAIYRVEQAGDDFAIHVLGESAPRGLCGSGLVDAVAWLLRNGHLDKVGRFTDRNCTGFLLSAGVELKRGDIDVLQRAKAAIGAGVQWLCRRAGLSPEALHSIYACGAFGRLLDVDNARQIGLLPPGSPVRMEGNAALAGCEALLMSDQRESTVDAVLTLCRIYNLAEDVEFESLFVNNLYLQTMPE